MAQREKRRMLTAIGLMSGTSMDGIDIALLRTDGKDQVERGPSALYPYDAAFRRRIEASLDDAKRITRRWERPGGLKGIEAEINRRHASAFLDFIAVNRIAIEDVDIVGFHGQTVLHRPNEALTVQIGDGNELAQAIGLPVSWDMRANDMQHGGQGAPLVPVYHRALARSLAADLSRGSAICFVNIGGISNITAIDGDSSLLAFDTGPGNALIDQWVQAKGGIPFDQDGMVASEGAVISEIAEEYLTADFFAKRPPKSLDRGDFPPLDPSRAELSDGARTLAHVTAASIFEASRHVDARPVLWILCGGGRKNRAIHHELLELAGPRGDRVVLAEEAGLDGDAIEAEAWAYLAVRSLQGRNLTFPGTTGVRQAVTGGKISRP